MPLAFSISLSRPLPVYVPSRLARGIPRRRRNASEKQQATSTHREQEVSRPQTPCSPKADPAMHRRDLDFISTLFMVEQQSEGESSDEANTSDEFTSSDESVAEEDVASMAAMGKQGKGNAKGKKNKKAERRGQGLP